MKRRIKQTADARVFVGLLGGAKELWDWQRANSFDGRLIGHRYFLNKEYQNFAHLVGGFGTFRAGSLGWVGCGDRAWPRSRDGLRGSDPH